MAESATAAADKVCRQSGVRVRRCIREVLAMSNQDDLQLARLLLNGSVEEDPQGRLRSKYFENGSPEELEAKKAIAHLLREQRPVDSELLMRLADLFDPPPAEQRKIDIVSRRPGRPADHVATTQIAQHIWDEMSGGKRYTDAINSAVEKFSVSEDTVKKLWGRYRPILEHIDALPQYIDASRK
jgi:hypothetical protein